MKGQILPRRNADSPETIAPPLLASFRPRWKVESPMKDGRARPVMHVRVDHDNCMETLLLKGSTIDITEFANTLMAESEIRHGHLNRVPVEMDSGHVHSNRHEAHYHVHAHPRN